ncbi:hypothetical protein F8280_15970 [Micromonospora noduli]|uniref:hypothetical protein n=1 Tax=Micromonospora noduli TaxID=709876 RepID=UPI0011BEF84B|nr:hypothetical protein [Micromonospora noduli]KAB1923407.1 hypothetical protein F8280_15970 [Micromonospora noduli]
MRLTDNQGSRLDAEYSAEPDGDHLAIILESQGGVPRRNRHYREALLLLLHRLQDLGALIEVALVDSRVTQRNNIPESERTILAGPVPLVGVPDLGALRRRLTTRQTTIAQRPGVRGGNSTKRVRIRLTVPGYSPADAGRLAADLAGMRPESKEAGQDEKAEAELLDALRSAVEIVAAEKANVTETEYERAASTVKVRRAETMLVGLYRQTLADKGEHRLRSAVGHTDLYLSEDGTIVEAKRGADHRYVREALGQLLDYAVNVTVPVTSLAALLPARPSDPDLGLLHTYGIDCIYWDGGLTFRTEPAPAEARAVMQRLWVVVLER